MNIDEIEFAVQGVSTPSQRSREVALCEALLKAADVMENDDRTTSWNAGNETVVTISDNRSVSIVADKGRSFTATYVDGDVRIRLACPIVDELESIDDVSLRAAAHARWSARVLTSPRSQNAHPAWTAAATNIAGLAAMFRTGASGACTLRPGALADPIKVECSGARDWRIEHSQAVTDYVASACPPSMKVRHVLRRSESSIVIEHGPETMCFASAPDPMETLRLMESTGLDPADLFRVEDDHG